MRRSEDRKPISSFARCRTPYLRLPMEVYDLSSDGFRIRVAHVQFEVGQSVAIRPEGFERLPGTIK